MLVGAKPFHVVMDFQGDDQIEDIILGYGVVASRATLE